MSAATIARDTDGAFTDAETIRAGHALFVAHIAGEYPGGQHLLAHLDAGPHTFAVLSNTSDETPAIIKLLLAAYPNRVTPRYCPILEWHEEAHVVCLPEFGYELLVAHESVSFGAIDTYAILEAHGPYETNPSPGDYAEVLAGLHLNPDPESASGQLVASEAHELGEAGHLPTLLRLLAQLDREDLGELAADLTDASGLSYLRAVGAAS